MRSLLDIIASGSISSLSDIACYLENTLKYTLCTQDECLQCYKNIDFNKHLFSAQEGKSVEFKTDIFTKFETYLDRFELEQLRTDMPDDSCRGCIFDFSKQVIAYLRKFNFLVFEQRTTPESVSSLVAPTQLGKAAFASSIPAEYAL